MMRKFAIEEILEMERFYRTTFMNSVSGFKSVNLCGTISSEGQANLAIFNSVVHIGANPPYLGMIFRPHTVPRHTLENILATKAYTLNHITADIYPNAHQTAARYASEQSEFKNTHLTPVFSECLPAPYVEESPIRIGLQYEEHHEIMNGTILVIGAVKEVFVPEEVVGRDGYVDLSAAGSLTVAGLDAYHKTELLGRMAYAKPDLPPRHIT